MTGRRDWKRFVLVRVGAAPVDLKPEQTVVMGRSVDADLTIPSQRVSRRHAELFWKGGAPWLRDCGSQNGTTVNGRRITEHELQDGDEIVVGPYMCTYRRVDGRGSLGQVMAAPDSNALTQPMVADAMAGNLEQMNLFELLQTLEFNQKSGTLEVFGGDGDGTLVVREGVPKYAKVGDQEGVEAVLSLLTWSEGQFSFSPDLKESSENMQASITGILLEAGRRIDETQ